MFGRCYIFLEKSDSISKFRVKFIVDMMYIRTANVETIFVEKSGNA